MESLGLAACLPDNLLDLSFDIGEEDDDEYTKPNKELRNASSFLNQNEGNESASLNVFKRDVPQVSFDYHHFLSSGVMGRPSSLVPRPVSRVGKGKVLNRPSLSELQVDSEYEEELEWLENKDSFPTLETVVDVLPNPNISKQQILVSILESSNRCTSSSSTNGRTITNHGNSIIMNFCRSIRVPVRARSKRRTRRRDLQNHDSLWGVKENVKTVKSFVSKVINGIKCRHCGAEKTPQWRAGPLGPKTLCNACGVRYKSGRLVPEYRPARSPTFSSELHSNSHRKVLEMRRQKQMMEAELGAVAVKPL